MNLKPSEKSILHQAILKYGPTSQTEMIVEECSELIKAIQKDKRNPSPQTKLELAGELADVEIMMYQARVIFCLDNQIDEIKKEKIERLRLKLSKTKAA